MKIQGTVTYINLAGGFWAIIGKDDEKWRPTNLPKSLQNEGQVIEVEAEIVEDDMSLFMWGTVIEIL